MVPTVFTELSQATTDSTKSPAAVAASKVYDLFVWNDSGTVRCTRGPAWTNATTRGYTLTMVDGILLNTSAITNGPAALRGTWVGTIASNASSQIDFIFGTVGPVAGVLNVWNAYNRVDVGCTVLDTSSNYAYASTTVRQAHASTSMQVSFVVGAQEDAFTANYTQLDTLAAGPSNFVSCGVGYDSITAYSVSSFAENMTATASMFGTPSALFTATPTVGSHYVSALEQGNAISNTFNSGGASSIHGLSFKLKM
jgi:hypothetical protein